MARISPVMELAFIECRSMGHAWYPTDADKTTKIGWYDWYRCERCTGIRKDTCDVHGDISARSYKMPEGYRHAGKVTKAEWRKMAHDRRLALVRAQNRKLRSVG